MSIIQGNAHTSAGGGYQIQRSLRFNSADSAYLNRTPASAGNRKTWTWSGWVKRCNSATTNSLFSAYVDANNFFLIHFRENGDNGRFEVFNYSSAFDWRVETNALLRDPSAWYHIVVALDTTQATNSNRIKIYVNGTLQTLATTSYPTLDFQSDANNNIAHYIGQDGASARYHNGYLTEVNFVDGQALTPSDFGETDSATGVWKPKAYSGTYGTNGFYLKFADNSNTTAATLGKDSSGNGNNWTPNNFSVTAGAGNDSLVDSPTPYGTDTGVGGTVRGNYATMNPLAVAVTSSISTLANGNLDVTTSVGGQSATFATISLPSSGKWYWEVTPTGVSAGSYIGIAVFAVGANYFTGGTALFYAQDGTKYVNSANSAYGASYTTNDVIGVAVDVDGGTVTFYKNNSSQGAITYSSGTLTPFLLDGSSSASSSFTANFGQRAFAYTAPSGFKALCTTNLPTPTIGATSTTQAGKYFNPVLYTGNGASRSITGVGFQPDLVWIKARSFVWAHRLADSVRGAGKELFSNDTSAELTNDANGYVSAFNSDGFSFPGGGVGVNENNTTYVAWNWNAGGSNATNNSGTITSTVRANTTSGFSIVTYTGNDTSGATVGHGLGVAPSMFIVKTRSQARGWNVYHTSLGNTKYIQLQQTGAAVTSSAWWNNTSPSSTTFTLGNDPDVNGSTQNYVAYCFANVEGYSRAFSYTGNGSSDGPFVFLGFRPRFVMIKRTDSTANWEIWDTTRSVYNQTYNALYPNLSNAEDGGNAIDINSNGFKLRDTGGSTNATSSATYIGFAIAENPFKYSLGR